MRVGIGCWAAIFAVLAGCAHTQESTMEESLPQTEIRGQGSTSGSIWREGLGDAYGDRRARGLGDIVTVNIVEEASASQEAETSTSRNSVLDAALDDVFGLPNDFGIENFLKSGQPFSPSIKGDYKRDFKGSGSTTRKETLVARVSAKVVQVLPGGNLFIQGRREIKVNREKQFIVLEGVIRPDDISPSNTVASTQIADAKIRYTGRGVLSDVQGPGWLARIMDWVWPL